MRHSTNLRYTTNLKHFTTYLLLTLSLLLAACESEPVPSFIKGNPYAKEFARLNGPVKSVVYTYYHQGKVTTTIRNDYSPEGVLLKSKTITDGDSVVNYYTYDPYNNIQDINGNEITDYKTEYKNGMLVKEWLYSDKAKKNGITNRYRIKGDTYIKKVNDIKTGAGTTYTYSYNSKGMVKAVQTMVNDGAYCLYRYDEKDHPILIDYYTPKGKLKYQVSVTTRYDAHDNCTQYVTRREGRIVEKAKIRYKYYHEDELKKAQLQEETTITNSSFIKRANTSEPTPPSKGLMCTIILCTLAFLAIYISYAQKHWGLFKNFFGTVEYNGMRKMWMYNSEPYVKMGILFSSVICAFLSSIVALLLFGGVTWFFFRIFSIVLGEEFAEWGGDFLDDLNALDWTIAIFHTYGRRMLLAIVIPVICFLALALILIICSYLLRFIEFATIKIYHVYRPCPYCGNKKNFAYVIDGKDFPVEPKPGVYGILHQTNHFTNQRVPTLLANGKGRLTRRCPHCQQYINTSHDNSYGTDVHIGIVGGPSSGKSYLLYSGLELLSKKWGKGFQQIEMDENERWEQMRQRIRQGEAIPTPIKSHYKAVQIRLKQKLRPIPYQLFFYDVAGGKLQESGLKSASALEFYSHVSTILFVIDPTTMEAHELEGILSTLKDIIAQVGRKPKDIDIIVTCTKKDLGYLEAAHYPHDSNEQQIKRFIQEELGLTNLDNALNNDFKSVGYAAVSTDAKDWESLEALFERIHK